MTELSAENLTIGYAGTRVAGGIRLTVKPGSVTCLLGPNGAGKTTLFKTLLGLIPPLGGIVRIDGEDLALLSRPAIARGIAYVPQVYQSDFAYSVLDLVVMGRTAHLGAFAIPSPADYHIAVEALATLGIANLAGRDANRISGGQRQLVLIARALAQQAGAIILDEPTASLDLANRLMVIEQVVSLARADLAVLVSTHEPEHAFAIATEVAVMGGDGHFEIGPVETVLTAKTLTRLYGVPLMLERTPSGRIVVGSLDRPFR